MGLGKGTVGGAGSPEVIVQAGTEHYNGNFSPQVSFWISSSQLDHLPTILLFLIRYWVLTSPFFAYPFRNYLFDLILAKELDKKKKKKYLKHLQRGNIISLTLNFLTVVTFMFCLFSSLLYWNYLYRPKSPLRWSNILILLFNGRNINIYLNQKYYQSNSYMGVLTVKIYKANFGEALSNETEDLDMKTLSMRENLTVFFFSSTVCF